MTPGLARAQSRPRATRLWGLAFLLAGLLVGGSSAAESPPPVEPWPERLKALADDDTPIADRAERRRLRETLGRWIDLGLAREPGSAGTVDGEPDTAGTGDDRTPDAVALDAAMGSDPELLRLAVLVLRRVLPEDPVEGLALAQRLKPGFKARDSRVRASIYGTIAAIGPNAEPLRRDVARGKGDPVVAVRLAAAKALQAIVRGRVPTEARLSFLSLLVVAIGGSLLILKIPAERTGWLYGIATLTLLIVLTKSVLIMVPSLVYLLDGSRFIVYFERDYPIAFGALFFAAALPLLDKEENRRAVKLMIVLMIAVIALQGAWTLSTPRCYRESRGVWMEGVCLQSTSFTCGAASVVTVARALGRPDVVEHEAAALANTIPKRGVNDLGAAMALRALIPGADVDFRACPMEEIDSLPLPCLAPIKYSVWFDHMTVLLEVDGDRVVIGDPLHGRVEYTRETLAGRWLGRVVTCVPPADFEPEFITPPKPADPPKDVRKNN